MFLVARDRPLSRYIYGICRNLYDGSPDYSTMVSYYQGYKTIEEWTNNFVERLLDKMEIQNNVKAWDGM